MLETVLLLGLVVLVMGTVAFIDAVTSALRGMFNRDY